MRDAGVTTTPTARCPDCSQVWLVPGLRPGEKCACKGCGRLIPVSGSEALFQMSAADSRPNAGAATLKGRQEAR